MTKIFSSALVTLILVVVCLQKLDLPLSAGIAHYLGTYAPFIKNANIPDLLLVLVVALTSLSWLTHVILLRLHIRDQRIIFCRVIGIVLPISFGLKFVFKWVFGRTDTRTWLADPSLYGFHWFTSAEGFQGFPSGHMLVLTPPLLALWYFYPRFRWCYALTWLGLAAALLITEYHFLSDVIAGAYLGAMVYWGIIRGLRTDDRLQMTER